MLGGAASSSFGGGLIPQRNGYAPAFSRAGQASVADWALDDIVALLRSLPVERNPAPEPLRNPADTARRMALGAALSADHCAACHGAQGERGQLASGLRVVPPLAGPLTAPERGALAQRLRRVASRPRLGGPSAARARRYSGPHGHRHRHPPVHPRR